MVEQVKDLYKKSSYTWRGPCIDKIYSQELATYKREFFTERERVKFNASYTQEGVVYYGSFRKVEVLTMRKPSGFWSRIRGERAIELRSII